MTNDFDTLVSAAIAREGGFVDHPSRLLTMRTQGGFYEHRRYINAH
jgi:hypothetical protein